MNDQLRGEVPIGIDIHGLRESKRWIGAYILHIVFNSRSEVRVGRMNGGRPLPFSKGDYIYIGSAMGRNDGLHLPRRLVRHATRSGKLPDHGCRAALLSHFESVGLTSQHVAPRRPKRLHWNVDFVLDHANAELRDVLYVCSERRLEQMIVQHVEVFPAVSAPFPGLGAHDYPGHTHLLSIDGAETWRPLCRGVESILERIA